MVKAKMNEQEIPQKKQKKRNFIDPQLKLGLINSVVVDHLPIYQAAILHKIKYSSAKHIVRNYLNNADNFFSQQKKRCRKIIFNNLRVIIDVNSGKIKFIKSTQKILPSNLQQSNQTIINNSLTDFSQYLLREIITSQNNKIKNKQYFRLEIPETNLPHEQQLSQIKNILKLQYEQMNEI